MLILQYKIIKLVKKVKFYQASPIDHDNITTY